MTTPKTRKMRARICAGCGKEDTIREDSKAERCKSCSAKEQQKQKPHKQQPKHGMRNTPEYTVWQNMKRRCYSPHVRGYENYGGRGIIVCKRWRASFKSFIDDVGRRPGDGYQLHRKNTDEGYHPGNCEWLSFKDHMRAHGREIQTEQEGTTVTS